MLHGNPTWSFLYRDLIAALRDRFRCVATDYLCFALSDRPPSFGYTPAGHASVVGEVIERLDLEDLIVMGHDWGGPTGLSAAADHSGRVTGLMLGNTAFWPPDRMVRLASKVLSSGFMQRRILEKNFVVEQFLFSNMVRSLTDEEKDHYRSVQPFPNCGAMWPRDRVRSLGPQRVSLTLSPPAQRSPSAQSPTAPVSPGPGCRLNPV